MTSPKWTGCVLQGAFSFLVQDKIGHLPPGPPESGPFSRGLWSLGLRDNEAMDQIELRREGVAVEGDVVVRL